MWMDVKLSRYSSSSTSGECHFIFTVLAMTLRHYFFLFSLALHCQKTKKLRLASPFLSIEIRLTFMDFLKKTISKRFYLKKYCTTLVVLYAVWEGQCKEALVGVTAVGRMGWKLAASLSFTYSRNKTASYAGWLVPDNFCTRQDKKDNVSLETTMYVVHQLHPKL